MTWRDDLMPAALNGVNFLYREVRKQGGRRTSLFEYPNRDAPFVEDLGRKARTTTVQAFVIGPNYHLVRNDLEALLEQGGVLDFQDPYRGVFEVKLLGDYDVRESDQEGGMAQFTFTLVEAGMDFPLLVTATASKVAVIAADAKTKLGKKFNLFGAIGDVIKSVLNALGKASSALRKANGKIAAALSLIDSATFLVDDFDKQLTTLLDTPADLRNKLTALQTAVMNLLKDFRPPTFTVDVIGFEPATVDIGVAVFLDLVDFEADATRIPTPTEQSELELTNLAAVEEMQKGGTLAASTEALVSLELKSAAQAAQVQAALAEQFDAFLAIEGLDPEVIEAFAALKAAAIEHFTAQQQSLPELAVYVPAQTMPALVIAYELYGDATRDLEIVDRNRIRHPGFVPGGAALEVLADD